MQDTNPLEAITEGFFDNPDWNKGVQDAEMVDPFAVEPEQKEEPNAHGLYPAQQAAIARASGAFNNLVEMGLHDYWLTKLLIPHLHKHYKNLLTPGE